MLIFFGGGGGCVGLHCGEKKQKHEIPVKKERVPHDTIRHLSHSSPNRPHKYENFEKFSDNILKSIGIMCYNSKEGHLLSD